MPELLVAAGRQDVVARAAVAVDPDGSGLESSRQPQGARKVAGEEAGGKPVGRVIGERERFLLVGEGLHGEHRAEDFLGHSPARTQSRTAISVG